MKIAVATLTKYDTYTDELYKSKEQAQNAANDFLEENEENSTAEASVREETVLDFLIEIFEAQNDQVDESWLDEQLRRIYS